MSFGNNRHKKLLFQAASILHKRKKLLITDEGRLVNHFSSTVSVYIMEVLRQLSPIKNLSTIYVTTFSYCF